MGRDLEDPGAHGRLIEELRNDSASQCDRPLKQASGLWGSATYRRARVRAYRAPRAKDQGFERFFTREA